MEELWNDETNCYNKISFNEWIMSLEECYKKGDLEELDYQLSELINSLYDKTVEEIKNMIDFEEYITDIEDVEQYIWEYFYEESYGSIRMEMQMEKEQYDYYKSIADEMAYDRYEDMLIDEYFNGDD